MSPFALIDKIAKAQQKKREICVAVKDVLASPQGRKLLEHLLERCYVTKPMLLGNPDANELQRRAALQDLCLDLLRTQNLSLQELEELFKANQTQTQSKL